jgi:cyclin-dependent kinase 1
MQEAPTRPEQGPNQGPEQGPEHGPEQGGTQNMEIDDIPKCLDKGPEKGPEVVGAGVYGTVYRVTKAVAAEHFPNVEYRLACKSIPHHVGGAVIMHDTALLEILCNRYLHDTGAESPGVVRYLRVDIGSQDTKLYMREYSHSLDQYMAEFKLNPGLIRRIMHHVLQGVYSLHTAGIVHRDIKPDNIFMDDPRTVAIGDYGFATSVHHINKSSPSNAVVQTEPYRAPEVFLGQTAYGTEIDMWSVGCIMFELFNQQRLLNSSDCYMKQLFAITGVPTSDAWVCLPGWGALQSLGLDAVGHGFVLKTRDKKARNLLKALLTVDPSQRITAADALNHEYFRCYRLNQVPPVVPVARKAANPTPNRAPKGMIFYSEKNRRKVFSYLEAKNQQFDLSAGNYFFTCDVADAFFARDTIPKPDINIFAYVCIYIASALRDNLGLAHDMTLNPDVERNPRVLLDMQLKILQALNFDLRLP